MVDEGEVDDGFGAKQRGAVNVFIHPHAIHQQERVAVEIAGAIVATGADHCVAARISGVEPAHAVERFAEGAPTVRLYVFGGDDCDAGGRIGFRLGKTGSARDGRDFDRHQIIKADLRDVAFEPEFGVAVSRAHGAYGEDHPQQPCGVLEGLLR